MLTHTEILIDEFTERGPEIKWQMCRKCQLTGHRFDARVQGYPIGWLDGDAETQSCYGCWFNDIGYFNQHFVDVVKAQRDAEQQQD